MFKHILASTDGSTLANKGVKQAIQLAKAVGARLTVVTAVAEYPVSGPEEGGVVAVPAIVRKRFQEGATEASRKLLDKIKADATAARVNCQTLSVPGNAPYKAIITQAKKSKCDLIVMASHGRSGISSILLGSETNKVLTHSTIPVLVVR